MRKKFNQQKGIGLVEVIVCLTIIAIAFWGFLELVRYNLRVQEQNKAKLEAMNLAIETLESVRSIRDENWDNLASLSFETRYYPTISGGKWLLALVNPGLIGGLYERWVTFEKVYRDANDNISSSGTEDPRTKKVTALIEWSDRGKIRQFYLTTYLTNWTK